MPTYGPLTVDVTAVTATSRPVTLDVELTEVGVLDLLVQFTTGGTMLSLTTGIPRFEIMTEQCIVLEQYAFVLGATGWIGEDLFYGRAGWRVTGDRPQLRALAPGKPHKLRWRLVGALTGGREVTLLQGYMYYQRQDPAEVLPPQPEVSPDLVRRAVTVQVSGAGGGSPPLGDAAVFAMPFTADIVGWYIDAAEVGSAVFDIWRKPEGVAGPAEATDTICFSDKPTLSSDVRSKSTSLDAWSTRLNSGDKLRVVLLSESGTTAVSLTLVVDPI